MNFENRTSELDHLAGAHHAVGRNQSPSEARAALVFFLLFGFMILAQFLIVYWKRKHHRSYLTITLLGLWLIPAIFALHVQFWRMLTIWLLWSLSTGYFVFKATRKPLAQNTPRNVYKWFFYSYKVSYMFGVTGYALIMLDFFRIPEIFGLAETVAYFGGLLLFYGIYFGVLARDCAELCADRMAAAMGIYNKKGLPSKAIGQHICAICGDNLQIGFADMALGGEKTCELPCHHSYHDFCIRGWIIIGKKDVCPYCSEKVDLSVVSSNPWETRSLLWANILDAIRYMIVWNPVIIAFTQICLYVMDFTSGTTTI